jgi:L-ascorbate metabolism protein UlaG (beta-lactamase superfamily)
VRIQSFIGTGSPAGLDSAATASAASANSTEQLPRFNKSGRVEPAPGIKVTAAHAKHSSTYVWRNGATGKDEVHVGGEPVGFIIELENGFRIWHTGDAGVFGDMKWIGDYYQPDLVLVPIGGTFTMDPVDAAFAIRELIRPKAVIPMHYGSSPLAKGTAEEFAKAMAGSPVKLIVLNSGEKAEF